GRSDFAIEYFGRVTSALRYRSWIRSVVVYSGRTGSPLFEIPGERKEPSFGACLDGGIDWDGDSRPDLLVGSPVEDCDSRARGHVHVYSGRIGSLLRTFERPAIPGRVSAEDSFGENVRFLGDLDGDGTPELLVGAPEDGLFEGTAYVLSGRDG